MTYGDTPGAATPTPPHLSVRRPSAGPARRDTLDGVLGPSDAFADRMRRALDALRSGRFVVVSDDHDREDEADLIMAAEMADEVNTAFMVRHTSGVLCAAITPERADDLDLPLMVDKGDDPRGTAFTVSVDLKGTTTTGISAADRAATLRALADPRAVATDFSRPGHVFPLRARPGGVLRRPGHTEGAVDLCALAGVTPAGVLCELVNDDGTMMRGTRLAEFAERHGLIRITIADIARFRHLTQSLVQRAATARLTTLHGEFSAVGYRSPVDDAEHLVLVRGEVGGRRPHGPVPVRIHTECTAGDVFSSRGCDCHHALQDSLRDIAAADRGAVIYFRPHDRERVALPVERPRLRNASEQEPVCPPVAHPVRTQEGGHELAGQILRDLGFTHVSLTGADAAMAPGLARLGLRITLEEGRHRATGT